MPSNASRMATHSETRTLRPGTFRAAVLLATHTYACRLGWGCSLTRTKYTGSPTVTGSMGFCGSVYNLYAILEMGWFPTNSHTPHTKSAIFSRVRFVAVFEMQYQDSTMDCSQDSTMDLSSTSRFILVSVCPCSLVFR